jgi:hypothetical protein
MAQAKRTNVIGLTDWARGQVKANSERTHPRTAGDDPKVEEIGEQTSSKPQPKPKEQPNASEKPRAAAENMQPKGNLLPYEPPLHNPDDLTKAAGLVGRLIDWITASALYPNRPLALGAAITVVGTLMGRRVMGPTQTGTHLYVIAVAETATGKQHALDCAKDALSAAEMNNLICSDIKSSPALVEMIKKEPVLCAVIDEYGQVLERLLRSNAGGSETDLLSVMRQLWGLGFGKSYYTPAALNRPTECIYGPAFSVCAATTPEDFGAALRSRQIVGGFFNRHLFIVGGNRPPKQDRTEDSWKVPSAIAAQLKSLRPRPTVDELLSKPGSEFRNPKEPPKPKPITPEIQLTWGPGAKAVWDELDASLAPETDRLKKHLFARVADNTVRIASILAFGRGSLIVDQTDMEWARAWALLSAQTMYENVLKYFEDPKTHSALCEEVLSLARASPDGFISHRDISRACRKYKRKGDDLGAAIAQLIDEERIEKFTRATAGRSSQGYRLLKD